MSTIEDRATVRIAQAIKDRREGLGLTLRALASRSGVSASMISDVERGAKSPTIATLSALALALGVPLSTLVDGAASPVARIHVVRAAERHGHVDPANGTSRDSLGAPLVPSKLDFLRYLVPPRAVAGPFAAHAPGTLEHMYLAAGSIRVIFGAEAVALEAGDSCTCLADAPHRFDNRESDAEASILIVVEGP